MTVESCGGSPRRATPPRGSRHARQSRTSRGHLLWRRAGLKLAEEAAESGGGVHTLGPLIHNPQPSSVARARVDVATTLDDVRSGTLVIRSHGVAPQIIDEARARDLNVVDATCPPREQGTRGRGRALRGGYGIVIVGEAAIRRSRASSRTRAERRSWSPRVGAARASAFAPGRNRGSDDTVPAPPERDRRGDTAASGGAACVQHHLLGHGQTAAVPPRSLPSGGLVVVVGGHNSGQHDAPAEICRAVNERVVSRRDSRRAGPGLVRGAASVGVTAGASTPDEQDAGRDPGDRSDGLRPMTARADYVDAGIRRARRGHRGGGARSPAQRAGLAAGDVLVAAQGEPLHDVVDWQWLTDEDRVELLLVGVDGLKRRARSSAIRASRGSFVRGVRSSTECAPVGTDCAFCFMAQLPRGLRRSSTYAMRLPALLPQRQLFIHG